jgi:hypothetical protein
MQVAEKLDWKGLKVQTNGMWRGPDKGIIPYAKTLLTNSVANNCVTLHFEQLLYKISMI